MSVIIKSDGTIRPLPPARDHYDPALVFNPATMEALSRAVCAAWGMDPDGRCILDSGVVGKMWQGLRVKEQVLAYLAMRSVGATLPARRKKEDTP